MIIISIKYTKPNEKEEKNTEKKEKVTRDEKEEEISSEEGMN